MLDLVLESLEENERYISILINIRKTFATYYSAKHGVEATSARMRHSSLQVTQDHYVNFQPKEKRTRQMYTAERTEFKPVALAGGKNDK